MATTKGRTAIMAKTTGETPEAFVGATAAGVVLQMKRTQWNAPTRKAHYMDEVRERVNQMTGEWLDIATPEAFLKSLEKVGLMTIDWAILLH